MGSLEVKPMVRHRTLSIEFKRQVAQEFLGGREPEPEMVVGCTPNGVPTL